MTWKCGLRDLNPQELWLRRCERLSRMKKNLTKKVYKSKQKIETPDFNKWLKNALKEDKKILNKLASSD